MLTELLGKPDDWKYGVLSGRQMTQDEGNMEALVTEKVGKELPLSDVAYKKIKDAILVCALAPGSKHSEQQLAAYLDFSRTPVHQAVVRLEQEGWLTFLPRKGVAISTVTAEEMAHVYEILMSLESLGVVRLASRPKDIDDGVDLQLEQARLDGEKALENHDLQGWARADDRFHTLFVDSSGNPLLSRLAANVREKAHRARLLTLDKRPLPLRSNQDHKEILDAIIRREPELARAALEAHRTRGMNTLLPILQDLQSPRDQLHQFFAEKTN
ncbi:GntR family transcriptional regulator|uniref:GntR family transcriptional regulator n=1 Tax=Pseudomonas sp. SbOxS1 TaxID=2723884 RepID=UPI0015D4098D|nr:GntR family transcriptional regulator [Pseudomonas sp. SbOxS1]NYU04864.1 GntR family transcriptional regulator [Pseudomonas sp. SbOxS1]